MERDVRLSIVQSILETPHRKLDALLPTHVDAEQHDPLFYIKFALWYHTNGNIRDHNKLFAAKAITSEWPEFRDVGAELLYRMSNKDFVTTSKFAETFLKAGTAARYRRLKKVAERIIRRLEKRANKDGGVQFLRTAKFIKSIYQHYHIKPGNDKIAASLKFRSINGEKLPAFTMIDRIRKENLTEKEICQLISDWKLPPLQTIGAVKELTPAIAASLLPSMTSAETVNFMKLFERRGLLDHPDFKRAVIKKTSKSTKSSSMRSKKASKSLSKHSDVADASTAAFVKSLPMIDKKVVLAIDKSFSMQKAIDIGKEVATILAAKVRDANNNLRVCLFDDTVKEIDIPEKADYASFEAKFRFIRANGTTSLGSVIEYIDDQNICPEVVLFITDADESDIPLLNTSLNNVKDREWVQGLKIINCKVGTPCFDLNISQDMRAELSLEIENIKYDGDYYALPNLVKLIATGGIRDLIREIDQIDPFGYFN